MLDIELYRQILGIKSPWVVDQVTLKMEEFAIYIYLKESPDVTWKCPKCGKSASLYDHRDERIWRHLDSCQFKTYLVSCIPRVSCDEHGVLSVNVACSEANSRFTLLFERFAIDILFATQVQSKAAKLLGLSPGQVNDIMKRAVERGLERRDSDEVIEHLSLDEKSFHYGHQYVSVLGDAERSRVLDICESRTKEAAIKLLRKTLTKDQRKSVCSITIDMWNAFNSAAKLTLPQADIIHDRFHISQYLNDAVDKTRRSEHKSLLKQNNSTLTSSKSLWLKKEVNLTNIQRERFESLRNQDLATAKVWSFKETFRSFFACKTLEAGRIFFNQWYQDVVTLGNRHITKVAEMLKRHLKGLLSYLIHHRTNATAESLNSRIQHIKACAHGFRKVGNYRIAILFFLGKLQLYPHKSS